MSVEPGTRVLRADRDAIAAAARCLQSGGLVAFPTETVYGLGADAGNGEAVARLYAAKGRPAFNPLIAHVAGREAARKLARFDADAEKLAAAFWPGPLTLVLPKRDGLSGGRLGARRARQRGAARAGTPAGAGAAGGLRRTGGGALGQPLRPCVADQRDTCARRPAGRIDMVIDGGPCAVGVELTIVACLASLRADVAAAGWRGTRRHRTRARTCTGDGRDLR